MNENSKKERLTELLADQTLFGLNEKETNELNELLDEFPEFKNDDSFENAATAIGLSNLKTEEIPHNLQVKILADSDDFFSSAKIIEEEKNTSETVNPVAPKAARSTVQTVQFEEPKTPFWQWLTPVFAGIGCIALLANIWVTYNRNQTLAEKNGVNEKIEKPKELTPTEKRQQLITSAKDVIKANWTSPTKDENLSGEIVWSDEKQEGYMTFKGLAKNDVDKETYQLWIFRDEKLEPHPIDGGVFDVTKDGDVIIPIDAKLKVKNPKVFAITVEKPGGVVVSKREKIPALAKVTA